MGLTEGFGEERGADPDEYDRSRLAECERASDAADEIVTGVFAGARRIAWSEVRGEVGSLSSANVFLVGSSSPDEYLSSCRPASLETLIRDDTSAASLAPLSDDDGDR